MRRFFEWITGHPRLVIGLVVVSTVALGLGLTRLKTEAGIKNMLPFGYPSVALAEEIEEVFEIPNSVAIAVVRERPGGIYTLPTLRLIDELTRKLADVRGIDSKKVWSIFTVTQLVGGEEGFEAPLLCDKMPETPEEIAALRARIEANDLYHGTLVSKDGTGALVFAPVTPVADKAQVYYQVRDLLAGLRADDAVFHVAGQPVVEGVIGQHVQRDMSGMMPLVSILIVVLLVAMFRSLRGLVLPLIVVAFSVAWAMGGMAWLKIPIYPMTTMIPILLMAMGVAYGIHIIARYYIVLREQRAADPGVTNRTVILATMMELWSPLIMASTTDAAGFLSLLTNKMKPVFYTGVFTSLGLLAALLFALVLVPAALALMKPGTAKLDGRVGTWEDRFFGRLGTGIFRRRKGIVAASVAVLIVSLVASRGLVVDSDPMSNFNQSDPIPIATKVINRLFSGAMLVHVVLESPTEKRFLDPAALAAVDRFQAEAARIPEVGATFSAANLVKMWQQAMNGGDPARKVVPPTRGLVANYLNFTGENANRYITMNRDRMNVELRVASTSTKVLGRVLADLEKVADRELRTLPGVTVRIGGHAPVLIDLVNVIVWGQVWSIVLSGILVFLITSAMFRSPVAGLFCAGPITLATAFNFGTMAVLGIRLEPATAVTACIGIGVGVDYGIHFIAKYKLMRARGFEGAALVESTMASAGKAIFFNAAVVIGGFLVLVTSQFPPSRHMGFMVSLNMFTSYLASVTVLPAMLAAFRPRFCEPREEEPAARAAA